jgi:hypothetical protein
MNSFVDSIGVDDVDVSYTGMLSKGPGSVPEGLNRLDTDGDDMLDTYDPDDDNDGAPDEQDIDPLNAPSEPLTPQPNDHDGDHLLNQFDSDHISSKPQWEQIDIKWEEIDYINWNDI